MQYTFHFLLDDTQAYINIPYTLYPQYEEEPETNTFLQWVLNELQQHKIQLLDMRSVLIKPVQRILK